ncbi:MAG: hypothetical protein IT223_05845 [Crocinitomicaceae bacterium]|nr:hypothetical protein [Crocinitomicaceae bacterium]
MYVAGGYYHSVGQLTNSVLIKYNSSGTAQWTNTYNNGTYNLQDAAYRIFFSGSNVAMIGASQTATSPITWKMFRNYYSISTGSAGSAATDYGDATDFATVKDVVVDGSFNVYVAGSVSAVGEGKNIRVVKFNTNLAESWVYNYNGADDGDDEALGLEIEGSYVYPTGYSTDDDEGKNLFAAKISTGTGSASWTKIIDEAGGDDEGNDLKYRCLWNRLYWWNQLQGW